MKEEDLKAFALEAAKGVKTEEDLEKISAVLKKTLVEAALGGEMTDHLGYARNTESDVANSRNGYTAKTVITDAGTFDLNTPRDRDGTFLPKIVKKGQTRFTAMDEIIISFYAKGMTTREIVGMFKELYGADVSPALISKVTDSVMERVTEWQCRPLDSVYPIVYLDCIVVKIRQDRQVIKKSIYLALGVNMDGHKELLGLWIAENEGAKFWLNVLTELQNRGVKDILFACVDGLKGFPDAISTVYPDTRIQLCIVHMVRTAMRFVSYKDYKAVAADLKGIYRSATEEQALTALEAFSDTWDAKYPQITKSWRSHWENLRTIFDYPQEIRKAIYTTNAIESLNSVVRKATNKRKVFPTDASATKVVYLAIMEASRRWTMPIHDWKPALNRFMIEFEERLTEYA